MKEIQTPVTAEKKELPARSEAQGRADLAGRVASLVARTSRHVYLRKADRLMILRPNKIFFVNRTAFFILEKLYSPEYHRGDPRNGDFSVDVARVVSECAAHYKVAKEKVASDVSNLFTTLSSLLRAQNPKSAPKGGPAPSLRRTEFGSHEIYYPLLSEIAMTYRCQLACRFCYAGSSCARRPGGREMSIEEIKKVITVIAEDACCPTLSFTGGEPTLRFDDLLQAVAFAKARGLRTNLITNGQALSDPIKADLIKEAGLEAAQVSIEGAEAGVHDSLTCVEGSFEKTVAAVKNLRERGIHVHTNSTISTANVESVYRLPEMLAGMGLKYFSVNMVIKTGSANVNDDLAIGYEKIGEKMEILAGNARKAGIRLVWYSPTPYCLFNPVVAGLGSKSCGAASGLFSVSPSGEVLPCSSFSGSLGNILEKSFRKIWDCRAAKYFRNKEFIPPVCKKCDISGICQGACPLYWDASGGFDEICKNGRGCGALSKAAWKIKRRLLAPLYGI